MAIDKRDLAQIKAGSFDYIEELDLEAFYAKADLKPPDEAFLNGGEPPDKEDNC